MAWPMWEQGIPFGLGMRCGLIFKGPLKLVEWLMFMVEIVGSWKFMVDDCFFQHLRLA